MESSSDENLDEKRDSTQGVSALIQSLSKDARVVIFSYSPKLRCLMSWTDNLENVLGVKAVSVAKDANLFLRYVHADDRFNLLTKFEQALEGKKRYQTTYRWIRPDTNETRWLHCRASLVETDTDPLFEGCILDLSEEFRNSKGASSSEDSVQTIIDALPQSILTLDRDLRILRVQSGFEQAQFCFGDKQFRHYKLSSGHLFTDCFADDLKKSHYQNICSKIIEGTTTKHVEQHTLDQETFELQAMPLAIENQNHGTLLCITNITARIENEQRLATLERGEALKKLAVGLSHNINNVMQSVLGQATAIRENPSSEEIVEKSSNAIIELTQKASSLTSQLFELEAGGDNSRSPVDLNLAAMAAVNKIEDVFSSGLKVAVAFGNPPIIMAEKPVLLRVLEHLLRSVFEINQNKRNVSITTYQVSLDEGEIENLESGTYAKLTISDVATIAEEKQNNLFAIPKDDPSYECFVPGINLVAELGGKIHLEKNESGAVVISLYFQVGNEPLRGAPKPELVENTAPQPNIMIIDDDLMVLDTVQRLLVNAGYNCLAAEDGHKALGLLRKHKDTIKVVLLDALMPGMNGARLLKKLREIRSDFKVIGFSGAPPEITRSLLEGGAVKILRKPVDPAILKSTIAMLFEEKRAA